MCSHALRWQDVQLFAWKSCAAAASFRLRVSLLELWHDLPAEFSVRCGALLLPQVSLEQSHKPTFTGTKTHWKPEHRWTSCWEQFGARHLDQGHLDMQTAGARVRPTDLPAVVDDQSSSRAAAAAQRDWHYAAHKDYSFQLHLPHFPVTRPCLCCACFY